VSYRDEKESLRAENERLRSQLEERRKRRPPWIAIVLALCAVVAFFFLQPWLNGNDARFWGALAIIAVLAIGALFAALRQV
jgi:hypothetical protein